MASAAPSPGGSYEIRGRWQLHQGLWQRGGNCCFRFLDLERASLRIGLPELKLLPRAQYLVKDGAALLHWVEPASAQVLLRDEDPLLEMLRALPAGAWSALLQGEGLADYMRIDESSSRRGWNMLAGSLGAWPARLEVSGERCRSLEWESAADTLYLRWRSFPAARLRVLEIRQRGKAMLRLRMRQKRFDDLKPEDWLFLAG